MFDICVSIMLLSLLFLLCVKSYLNSIFVLVKTKLREILSNLICFYTISNRVIFAAFISITDLGTIFPSVLDCFTTSFQILPAIQ